MERRARGLPLRLTAALQDARLSERNAEKPGCGILSCDAGRERDAALKEWFSM
jgi:hypothetical protein